MEKIKDRIIKMLGGVTMKEHSKALRIELYKGVLTSYKYLYNNLNAIPRDMSIKDYLNEKIKYTSEILELNK